MFERFTEKAIKVIMLAQEEARRLGHNYVGTEQILLGLIAEGTGSAAKALKSMGVKLKDARIEVENIIGRGSGFVATDIPFTPRVKQVLELSLDEARHLGNIYIDTEHLLLGIIREGSGVAVLVLERFHVNLHTLKIAIFYPFISFEVNFFIEPTEQQSQGGEESLTCLDSFVIKIAEEQHQIREKYRSSFAFIDQLETLRAFSSDAVRLPSYFAPNISVLGSGQIPEEIRLVTSALNTEIEMLRLLTAEVEVTEGEIKAIQSNILLGIVFLLIGLGIYFLLIGWMIPLIFFSILPLSFLISSRQRFSFNLKG
jgi:hypothetical protein